MTPRLYVLTLAALARQWDTVVTVPGFGNVRAGSHPNCYPPADDSATRAAHATIRARNLSRIMPENPENWPSLATLLTPVYPRTIN